MKRVIAFLAVLVWGLVAPPAKAQTGFGGWSSTGAEPVELAGEVVLTFTAIEAGRITYYTLDGDCNRNPGVEYPYTPSPVTPDCGRPQARAGEDYVAVRGEWIFTEPGSRTIRVPILDDDIDEPEEPFGVHASKYDDVAGQTTWSAVVIRIIDDDPKQGSAGDTSTKLATAEHAPGADQPVAATSPAAPVRLPTAQAPAGPARSLEPTTTSVGWRLDVGTQLGAPGDLQPGPGFELVADRDPERGPERGDRGGRASWVAFGLTIVAVASGIARVRRRWRWSTPS